MKITAGVDFLKYSIVAKAKLCNALTLLASAAMAENFSSHDHPQ